MSSPLRRRLRRLLGRRRVVLALAAAGGLVLAAGLPRLATDNSAEVFFVHDSPRLAEYAELRRWYGDDEAVRLAVSGDGLWTAEGLAWLGRLERAAGELPGVADASGLATHHGRDGWPPDDPAALRRRATAAAGLDRALGWVGRDGDVATVLVRLTGDGGTATLEALAALAAEPPPGLAAELAGIPVLDHALDGSSQEIGDRYFPLLALLATLLLGLTFRRLSGVVVPLLFVAAALLATLGPMGFLGVELNLVLAVLPPLLFAIALATAVHLVMRFRQAEASGLAPVPAVLETYRDKGWAVLWTGVTTLVGFASLAVSPVGPVRTLGLWAGIGIGAMTLLAFTLLPALLATGGGRHDAPPPRLFELAFRRRGRRWAEWAARRRWPVLTVAALVAAAALAGIPRLQVESNALRYLSAEHPARRGIEALEEHGIGAAAVELMLTLPAAGTAGDDDAGGTGGETLVPGRGFATVERLDRLARLTAVLRADPVVLGAVSAGDLVADVAGRVPAFRMPPAVLRATVLERMTGDAEGRRALAALLADGGTRARVTVFIRTVGHRRLEPLIERIERAAGEVFPEAAAVVTGELPLLVDTHRQLLRTLGLSLSLTLLSVAVIFRLLLGSSRLAMLAMLPNLWPVAGVLGGMGWLGVPLDVATVMVASVVLGLAVDDTIHTLGHFRELEPRSGRLEAVAGTLEHTAPAYVLTGIILAIGFGVCAVSDFAPTARFGALSAAAVGLAVAGDLLLLPALLGATPQGALDKVARWRAR